MTKHPIFFVPGRWTPFYCFNYWNNIPYFMKEHGYEVVTKPFSIKGLFFHEESMVSFLKKQSTQSVSLHLIFDPTQIKLARKIAQQNFAGNHHIYLLNINQSPLLKTPDNVLELTPLIKKLKKPGRGQDWLKKAHDKSTRAAHAVPSHYLGADSENEHLTVEPMILKSIISIAENDWR